MNMTDEKKNQRGKLIKDYIVIDAKTIELKIPADSGDRIDLSAVSQLDLSDIEIKLSEKQEQQKKSEIAELKQQFEKDKLTAIAKEKELLEYKMENQNQKRLHELEMQIKSNEVKHIGEIENRDNEIALLKQFKLTLSTKMVGESLEKHCETEYEQHGHDYFPNGVFAKDNDASSGSKGDYIYRENDQNGNEIISIMFEMKNEQDTTSTKHKNKDFYRELDKDRCEKKCEYAVLVSLLEKDNEIYNGIYIVHEYEKMFVVRPQFFLPIIKFLRLANVKALDTQLALNELKNTHVDIAGLENNINQFKESFSNNARLYNNFFDKALTDIDKSIDTLQKTKEDLLRGKRQLEIASNKADDLSLKKITKGTSFSKK
jgi:hypothetical protein